MEKITSKDLQQHKYSFEVILNYFNKYNKFKVVNLLLADTYGPNDKE